jgi:hypothetical protein
VGILNKAVALALGATIGTAAFLTGCGGNSGSTLPLPRASTPAASPSPSIAPSVSPSPSPSAPASANPHPASEGDTFAFSGSSRQVILRFRPTPTPPAQVITATVTQNQTVHVNRLFHGISATDFQTVETDAGPNQTITTNADEYFLFPSGAGPVVNIGFSSIDSNGVSLDVQYLTGNGLEDFVPETPGASWTNTASAIVLENDPDGTTSTQSVNADGSYQQTKSEVAGQTTITQASDGTGTLVSPTTAFLGTGTGTQFQIGVNDGTQIPITISAVGASPPPISILVASWYPASPTLAADQTTDQGMTALPVSCAGPSFGTTGMQLHRTKSRLDTVLGFTETEVIDTWIVPGAGPVCVNLSDTVQLYYDFTGQTAINIFSSSPHQTATFVETIALQSETVQQHARRQLPGSQRSFTQAFARRVAVANYRAERFRQGIRMQQLRGLRRLLQRGMQR